jgi:hypothetical protein
MDGSWEMMDPEQEAKVKKEKILSEFGWYEAWPTYNEKTVLMVHKMAEEICSLRDQVEELKDLVV